MFTSHNLLNKGDYAVQKKSQNTSSAFADFIISNLCRVDVYIANM